MSFVLNKNINLKYIFGRKCPAQTVILSMQSRDINIFSIIAIGCGCPTTRHVEPVETSSRQAHIYFFFSLR